MTAALCINCGNIKQGILVACNRCSEESSGNYELELALSDHYLSIKTLQSFSSLISKLQEAADNKILADWAFIYLLSTYFPEIVFISIPKEYIESSIVILKSLSLNNIIIEDSALVMKGMIPEEKYSTTVKHYTIDCPYCKAKKSIAAWHIFNGTSDQHLKQLLIEGRIFNSRCMECSQSHQVNYDMVYFDIIGKPVVIHFDNPEADPALKIDTPPKSFFEEISDDFNYRKVEHFLDLIEKVRIFDQKLDDIEVELAKLGIYFQSYPDSIGKLYFSRFEKGLIKSKRIVFYDPENEFQEVKFSSKRGKENPLIVKLRELYVEKGSEWLSVNIETIRSILEEKKMIKRILTN